jgi:hypothetical protein
MHMRAATDGKFQEVTKLFGEENSLIIAEGTN